MLIGPLNGRLWAIPPLILAVAALAGCGGGSSSSTPEVASSPSGAQIEGDSAGAQQIAAEVQKYLERNCPPPGTIDKTPAKYREDPSYAALLRDLEGAEAMCGNIASIQVDGLRVTIRSEIEPGTKRGAGEAFCNLIRGSDVADETPGHELQDIDGSTIATCPVGDDPPDFR